MRDSISRHSLSVGFWASLFPWLALGGLLADSAVNFVVTVPGKHGHAAAFGAEVVISFLMMTMILFSPNSVRWARRTPFLAGLFVAVYIAVENPLFRHEHEPSKDFQFCGCGGSLERLVDIFTAPSLAMLCAAEVFVRIRGPHSVLCAKLNHRSSAYCIFNCDRGWNLSSYRKSPSVFECVRSVLNYLIAIRPL